MNYLGILIAAVGVLFIIYAIKGGSAVQTAKAQSQSSGTSSAPPVKMPPAGYNAPGPSVT